VLLVAALVKVRLAPLHKVLGVAVADTALGTTFTVTAVVVAAVEPQALVAVSV
jgi:hypothetical protein